MRCSEHKASGWPCTCAAQVAARLEPRTVGGSRGISPRTLERIEAETTSNPGLFTVAALADAFGVSIDELVREARGAEEAGIVSAGYEGRNIEQFVEQLLARNVRTVADVRLTPSAASRASAKPS